MCSYVMIFQPTREAGLERLNQFLPHAGRAYANRRNYDDGPSDKDYRRNVSQLSPWLHFGLLNEQEVIEAVLRAHRSSSAEKFISEIFWRIYFKGYLEQRPTIWRDYVTSRDALFAQIEDDKGLSAAYEKAISGRTGIDAFDHWARELIQIGYLHNHARMWFASIWIFTLKLDWQLGADFFLRHLIDADAASNTLSWRWVGGLHTKGKTYLARTSNIARYTANQPGGALAAKGLSEEAPALKEQAEHSRKALQLPAAIDRDWFDEPYALILHDEATNHAPLNLLSPPSLVIGIARPSARSPNEVGQPALDFATKALTNGLSAASNHFTCREHLWSEGEELSTILAEAGIDRIALPYLTQGWTRDALEDQLSPLAVNHNVVEILSDLSRATWPHARAGFFGVKKKIERILREVGITQGALSNGASDHQLPMPFLSNTT